MRLRSFNSYSCLYQWKMWYATLKAYSSSSLSSSVPTIKFIPTSLSLLPWQYPTSGSAITNAFSTTFRRSSIIFASLWLGKVRSRSRFISLFSHLFLQSSNLKSGYCANIGQTTFLKSSKTPSRTNLITCFSPSFPEFLISSKFGKTICQFLSLCCSR